MQSIAQIQAKYPRQIDHKVWDYINFRVKLKLCVQLVTRSVQR